MIYKYSVYKSSGSQTLLHISSLTGSERGLEAGVMSRDPELLKPMKKRRRRDYLSPSEEDSEPEPMVRLKHRYRLSNRVILVNYNQRNE